MFPSEDLKEFGECLSQICVLAEWTACIGPGAYFGQVGSIAWERGLVLVCNLLLSVPVTTCQREQLCRCKRGCCH